MLFIFVQLEKHYLCLSLSQYFKSSKKKFSPFFTTAYSIYHHPWPNIVPKNAGLKFKKTPPSVNKISNTKCQQTEQINLRQQFEKPSQLQSLWLQ